jgi:chemotaxis signal transduction protein
MTQPVESTLQSFVLLRLGERRFAVAAVQISELVSPSRIFRFPHRTPKLEGVILRRGRIVPVCDVAEKLLGQAVTSRRFYLIALRHYGDKSEWVALPVTGDCELIAAEMTRAAEADAPHVAGWISHNGEVLEVLNLDELTPGAEAVVGAHTPVLVPEVRP